MKKSKLNKCTIPLLLLVTASCTSLEHFERTVDTYTDTASRMIASQDSDFNPSDFVIEKSELQRLQESVELNLSWRTGFAKVAMTNKPEDNEHLKKYLKNNLEVTQALLEFFDNIAWITEPSTRFEITTKNFTKVEVRKDIYFTGNRKLKRHERDAYVVTLNPYDNLGTDIVKAVKLGLIANIAIYENHLLIKKKLRTHLDKNKAPGLEKFYNGISYKMKNTSAHEKLAHLLSIYRDIGVFESAKSKTKLSNYINPLINKSLTYKEVSAKLSKKPRWNKDKKEIQKIVAAMANENKKINVSYFANTISFENEAVGKVSEITKSDREHLLYQLMPMDITFTHNNESFNNVLVNNFWDNVGIWVGSWEEIVELGLGSDPSILKYKDKIKNEGFNYISATREGVKLLKKNSFINNDDIAVIRKRNFSYKDKVRNLRKAFSLIGKDYDYKMDASNDKRISFAELVFNTYPEISWDKSFTYKQEAVSPYKVAKESGEDKEFFTVFLYKNGEEIIEDLEDNFRTVSSEE